MRAPDVDRTLSYTPRWNRREGRCRLRAWHDEAIVVVSELPDNPGPSVTNAIEVIARLVELVLVGAIDEVLLVEHYPANSQRGSSWDVVTFTGRRDNGDLVGPAWAPLPEPLRQELREVVEGVDA